VYFIGRIYFALREINLERRRVERLKLIKRAKVAPPLPFSRARTSPRVDACSTPSGRRGEWGGERAAGGGGAGGEGRGKKGEKLKSARKMSPTATKGRRERL